MATHAFGQQAVGLTARGYPAARFFLRGAAFLERSLGECFLQLRQLNLPGRIDAIDDEIFEHLYSFLVVVNMKLKRGNLKTFIHCIVFNGSAMYAMDTKLMAIDA